MSVQQRSPVLMCDYQECSEQSTAGSWVVSSQPWPDQYRSAAALEGWQTFDVAGKPVDLCPKHARMLAWLRGILEALSNV